MKQESNQISGFHMLEGSSFTALKNKWCPPCTLHLSRATRLSRLHCEPTTPMRLDDRNTWRWTHSTISSTSSKLLCLDCVNPSRAWTQHRLRNGWVRDEEKGSAACSSCKINVVPLIQAWIPQAIVVQPLGRMRRDVGRRCWEVGRGSWVEPNPSLCSAHSVNAEWRSEDQR